MPTITADAQADGQDVEFTIDAEVYCNGRGAGIVAPPEHSRGSDAQ